jgi:hypothetical protein
MKKAQGLSMTTIIVAALALLVLVVLALIFSGRMRIFGTETNACRNLGGECRNQPCDPATESRLMKALCPEGQDYCCIVREERPSE